MSNINPVDLLKEIVQTNTTNPPGNELHTAKAIKRILDDNGIENELMEFEEGRANLVAWLRGEKDITNISDRKVLGLSGHMDVVPAGQVKWEVDPFSAEEMDGKIYGRGTSDMKGGLTALLSAMIELKRNKTKLNGDVKFLITAGEEYGAVGAKQLVKDGQMKDVSALIIAEPTNSEIYIAEKGVLWLEVTTFGKTAHGSSPSLGINAIQHMYLLLKAIHEKYKMDFESNELLGEPTFNISMINGGVNTNVVPDQCSVQIDFRTVPGQSHEKIIGDLKQLFKEVQYDIPDLNFEIAVLNELPAIKTDKAHPFLKDFRKMAEDFYKSKKEFKGINVYTDGAILKGSHSEIPLVIFGAGKLELAHQPNEYIEIEPFLSSIEFYKSVIADYLS